MIVHNFSHQPHSPKAAAAANLKKLPTMQSKLLLSLLLVGIITMSCENSNDKMVKILEARYKMYNVKANTFASAPEVAYYD